MLGKFGKTPWNKGLTAATDKRIALMAEALCGKGHKQTEAAKAKISKTMRQKGLGGLRKGSGRGKKGYYKGVWCDSTWELAYVLYNIDHNIDFVRNTKGFEYTYNGGTHRYYPDFMLPDDTYIEVKGYYTSQTHAKLQQFSHTHKLVIIDKLTIKPYLEYAVNKYGQEFYNLYDKA